MFNVRFIIGLVCLFMLVSAGHVIADTEISGAVSGEWTSDGSPYIVVDSTWVPEGDSLILRHGTELQFCENQGLHVFGTFETYGNNRFADSVRIRVADDVESWKGLCFYGGVSAQMNYTWIVCPGTAIYLDEECTMTMNYCKLEAEERAFYGYRYDENIGWNFNFFESEIKGAMYLYMFGGSIIAENSYFDFSEGDPVATPGFLGEGNYYRFSNCVIENGGIAGSFGTYCTIEDSQILHTNMLDLPIGVGAYGGGIRGSYIEGNVSSRVHNGGQLHFTNNTILGQTRLYGDYDGRGTMVHPTKAYLAS